MAAPSAVPGPSQQYPLAGLLLEDAQSLAGRGQPVAGDRPDGALGFFDNLADRPITATSWQPYEIEGNVAADAVSVHVGVILRGGGRAWLGAATFAAIGKTINADEPARPLGARGLENLVAFARLAGLVRYPSQRSGGQRGLEPRRPRRRGEHRAGQRAG